MRLSIIKVKKGHGLYKLLIYVLGFLKEHFFDPASHTGFLEDKLRNIRRNLRDDQRRYRKRGGHSSEIPIGLEEVKSDESVQEWITIIKRMKPSPDNISSIKMGMDKTYSHRRYWISNQSPTLAEIVENYPRFIDMPFLVSPFNYTVFNVSHPYKVFTFTNE